MFYGDCIKVEVTDSQRKRLVELRRKAFEYNMLREFRGIVNYEQIDIITRIVRRQSIPFEVLHQMKRDLSIYKVYDALAMWLDDEQGLAPYCPDALIEIGTALISYAENKSVER